jgi:hypothetical protein
VQSRRALSQIGSVPDRRKRHHNAALASAAGLSSADRSAEASSASAVVGGRCSAVGVGKVGESRLVDAEAAGAGQRSDLEVDTGPMSVQLAGAFHGGGVAPRLIGEVLRRAAGAPDAD